MENPRDKLWLLVTVAGHRDGPTYSTNDERMRSGNAEVGIGVSERRQSKQSRATDSGLGTDLPSIEAMPQGG
jgi:hypothetical protein